MNIYPFTVDDNTPNACRSSWNPTEAFIGLSPQRGNMSPYPVITDGWCGSTGGISVNALGEIDVNDPDWFEQLRAVMPERANLDRADLERWLAEQRGSAPDYGDDSDDEEPSYRVPLDTSCGSASATWDEGDEHGEFYPSPRDGWTHVAHYDTCDALDSLETAQLTALEQTLGLRTGVSVAEKLCDIAGIDCDVVDHTTYNSGTNGTDWAICGIRDGDVPLFAAVAERAGKLADCGWFCGEADKLVSALRIAAARWRKQNASQAAVAAE